MVYGEQPTNVSSTYPEGAEPDTYGPVELYAGGGPEEFYDSDASNSTTTSIVKAFRKIALPTVLGLSVCAVVTSVSLHDMNLCSKIQAEPETRALVKAYNEAAEKYKIQKPFSSHYLQASASGQNMLVFDCPIR